MRQLLGFEKPEDTPLAVIASVFHNMGWELEETPTAAPPMPGGTGSVSEALAQEDNLSQILAKMFSPFIRPSSIFATLAVDSYFTSMKILHLQKPMESARLLSQRDAADKAVPLLKQMASIIMEESAENPEFLLHIMLRHNSGQLAVQRRELLLQEYSSLCAGMMKGLHRDDRERFSGQFKQLEKERDLP